MIFSTLFFYSHYFLNGGFFESDTHLLDNVAKIRHIPGTIVQGRYDCVCPAETAWLLHKVIHLLSTKNILVVVCSYGGGLKQPFILARLYLFRASYEHTFLDLA